MTDPNEFRLIDTTNVVDVGQGYQLAWCIGTDGAQWPLLYDTRQVAPQFFPYLDEHWRDEAPHELIGRLPDRFASFWCGARTSGGKRCRSRVRGPGIRCRHHLEATPAPPTSTPAELTLFDLEPEARTVDDSEPQERQP